MFLHKGTPEELAKSCGFGEEHVSTAFGLVELFNFEMPAKSRTKLHAVVYPASDVGYVWPMGSAHGTPIGISGSLGAALPTPHSPLL